MRQRVSNAATLMPLPRIRRPCSCSLYCVVVVDRPCSSCFVSELYSCTMIPDVFLESACPVCDVGERQ